MQSSSGEHHHQPPYYLGGPCDPNLLAFAQHALLGYPGQPHKSMYPQAFPSSQLPPLLLPPQVMPPHSMPSARNLLPSLTGAAIPEMDKLSVEEPIEAGNLPYRRSDRHANKSLSADDSFNHRSSSSSSHFRRHSAHWETMTDDERELIQRQKRKEEAFKTALCDAYKRAGNCPYGDSCRFAHGENELRMPSQPRGKAHPKYKTQLCDKFSTFGQCPYGPRCQFIHKLKKGLPLLEYNRALYQGQISPARDDEITNPDESADNSGLNLTRTVLRRRSSALDTSDSGYGGSSQRHCSDEPRGGGGAGKVVYPPMQVVNIEMATGQRRSSDHRRQHHQNSNHHHHHHQQHQQQATKSNQMINQADYEAAMASGKIFGKPLQENIRTYGAMIRANEEHVERSGTKKDRVKVHTQKKDLSLIREENTLLVEDSQLHQSAVAPPPPTAPTHTSSAPTATAKTTTTTTTSSAPSGGPSSAWYEKIFGEKMTIIKEESLGEEDDSDDDDVDSSKMIKRKKKEDVNV